MRYQYMICPVRDLGTHAWSNAGCTPNSVFIWREYQLWPPLNAFLSSLVNCVHYMRTSLSSIVLWILSTYIVSYARLHTAYSIHEVPAALPCLCYLRFSRRAIRRILRLRVQTCIQPEGLWGLYSWAWRDDGPHGLPVRVCHCDSLSLAHGCVRRWTGR